MNEPSSSYDVAVIGAGLLGSATAWRLTQRGVSVAVLERTTPANRWGSSHGSARIFRYAYFNPFYAEMTRDARALWDELEEACGTELLHETGCLDFGPTAGVHDLHSILGNLDIDSQVLSAQQARQLFPHIATDTEALHQPTAGVVDAEKSVEAMLQQADKAGATLYSNWEVESAERQDDGFRLTSTAGDIIFARKVAVAAGGWITPLLEKLPLSSSFKAALPEFTVWQEQAFHFPYREGFAEESWPTTIHRDGDVQVYSLPGGRDADSRGQKVARFLGGKIIDSAATQDGIISESNRQFMMDYVSTYLPGLIPEPYAETTCLFTSTPSEDFVIDEEDGLVVISACSGHGAKTAPMTGEYAARLLTGQGEIPEILRPSLGEPEERSGRNA